MHPRLAAAIAGLVAAVAALLFIGGGHLVTSPLTTAPTNCAPVVGTGNGAITWPMAPGSFRLTSGYGARWGTFHAGIDMAAPIGTPILAAHDGVVSAAGPATGFGLWAVVDGVDEAGQPFSTVYGHNNRNLVTAGQTVAAGEQIAEVGNRGQSTGPHLHFEVWPGTRATGSHVDPAGWLADNAGAQPADPGVVLAADPPPPPDDGGQLEGPIPPQGEQRPFPVDAEQRGNAETIVAVAKGQDLPLRVAVIAVATAMQESGLRVIDFGDQAGPDSRGLFQQRDPWGSYAERMDPATSTLLFLNGGRGGQAGLLANDWQNLSLEDVVVDTQISVGGYAKWETAAIELVGELAGIAPIGSAECVPGTPGGADGAIIPAGLTTVTSWPVEDATVPDPTGTGGMVTPRTAAMVAALEGAGYTAGGMSCWDEHPWNPSSDHPRGLGCDVFFDHTNPADVAIGWAAANWLVEHQPELGVKYLIWQGQFWSASDPGRWIPYESTVYNCPDPTNVTGCHYDHIHVSMH